MGLQRQPDTGLLQTRQHFYILDGLRGIAALSVVVFHFMEIIFPDAAKNFIGHGFLAVDFFFCLSGFVIGYAYDDRISKIGIKNFFISRLIRLHPLVVLGAVLGLLAFLFDPFGGQPELYSAGQVTLLFLSSIFLIPYPVMPERYFNLFSFNAPSWSLFWEYIANIFYAFILCRMRRHYLLFLTVLAAAILCLVAYREKSLVGGWDGSSFWDGGARVFYSFLAGLLVYRSGWIIRTKLGFSGLSVLLVMSFIMPFTGWNWLTEPLVVLFYFPLLVALGAGSALAPEWKKVTVLFGQISYPLYMTHYAALWGFGHYYATHKSSSFQLYTIVITAIVLLTGLAYIAMRVYDIPIRKYLTRNRHV